MITKIAGKVMDALCAASVVNEDDRELYSYGFFVLLSSMFFFIVTSIFGAIFNVLWESVLFFVMFTLIRSYAGGVHASKEITCSIYTSLSMLVCVALIQLQKHFELFVVPLIVIFVSYIVIVVLCPLDTDEKPLDDSERKKYKKISCILASVILVGGLCTMLIGVMRIFYLCTVCLGLESILLMLGKLKGKSKQQS